MICSKCGNAVSEDSKFCGVCGAPIQKENFCPICGQKFSSGLSFCTNCGTKLKVNADMHTASSTVVIKTKVQDNNFTQTSTLKGRQTGRLLREMKGVTKFLGEPTVGVANKMGTLSIYDNRVEFVRKAGLTLVGTINAIRKAEVETYYYSDCASITTGTYMMGYVTLVLNLNNGTKISFCPALPVSRDMETVVNLILYYV